MGAGPEKVDITCYDQVNHGDWCMEHYETASRDAHRRLVALRKAGYEVKVSKPAEMPKGDGTVKMTRLIINPGIWADTLNIPGVKVEEVNNG